MESSALRLLSLLKRLTEDVVLQTLSPSRAKELYSRVDCSSSARRSTTKTTLSAKPISRISWPALNEVIVLPPPVVHQMKPPRC